MSLTFASLASSEGEARSAALAAAGLREFGGRFADARILLLVPEGHSIDAALPRLERSGVQITPFGVDAPMAAIPFGVKAAAAAFAEGSVAAGRLAWLDADTLVVGEPAPFAVPDGIALGYRPVHHRLIGTPWGEEPDEFWQAVDDLCGARGTFPVTTHTGERIRAYFSAGSYVVDPARGLLHSWRDALAEAGVRLTRLLEADPLRRVFLHQAVFTAVALARLDPAAMSDLGTRVNYPVHLHQEVPARLRPASIEDLLDHPDWRRRAPWGDRLEAFIERNTGS
jgi:hypothetical protein